MESERHQQGIKSPGLSEDCIRAAMQYQELEENVRRIVTGFCAPFCSACADPCCRKEICFESIDSFWLELVRKINGPDHSDYDNAKGWLTTRGCQLQTGRPPVCYEYFCSKIDAVIQEEPDKKNCLIKISGLLSFAGEKALGNRHIVTLSSKQILEKVNFLRLNNKITKSIKLYRRYEVESFGF